MSVPTYEIVHCDDRRHVLSWAVLHKSTEYTEGKSMKMMTIKRDDRFGHGTVQLVTKDAQNERFDITNLCSKLIYKTKQGNTYLSGRLICDNATACGELLKLVNHHDGLVSFLLIVEVVLQGEFRGKTETLAAVELDGCDETTLGFRYSWFDS